MNINDLKTLFPRFSVDTFEHVLGHVSKATGKLHGLVGDADHIIQRACGKIETGDREAAFNSAEVANGKGANVYIADLIICAAKLAALCPSGEIDLEKAVTDRIAEKRDYMRQYGNDPFEGTALQLCSLCGTTLGRAEVLTFNGRLCHQACLNREFPPCPDRSKP